MKACLFTMVRPLRLCALLGVAALGLAGCSDPDPLDAGSAVVRPIKAFTIPAATDGVSRSFPGRVRAAERVELAFSMPGKLIELPVVPGQAVDEGDVVARLDPRDYESEVQAAQAQFNEAKANFERGKDLVEQGHISRMDFDRLRANYEVAGARLTTARKALDDTALLAPFGGTIARRHVDNYQEIRANEPIVSLQDNRIIEIVVDAPEQLVAASPGDGQARLVATFEALPGVRFPLTVREYSAEADPDTQTYEIVLAMPRPEGANILPGMTANVIAWRPAPDGPANGVIRVPAVAVFANEAGEPQVWTIAADGTVGRQPVTTGALAGQDRIEILSGLEPGDTIAVAGVTRLREGQVVRPVDSITYD